MVFYVFFIINIFIYRLYGTLLITARLLYTILRNISLLSQLNEPFVHCHAKSCVRFRLFFSILYFEFLIKSLGISFLYKIHIFIFKLYSDRTVFSIDLFTELISFSALS